jgi:CDP-diacylglycerol--glycerol-3-phosphate 3-phosphatidyltransferase
MITLATKVTIFRIFLVAPITLLLAHNYLVAAGFGLALAAFTDWLDGYIARRYHQQTALGALLDPLADKLLMVSIFTVTWHTYSDLIPGWFIIFLWLKESVLACGAFIFFLYSYKPVAARISGKIAMACQLIYGLLLFFTRYNEINIDVLMMAWLGLVTGVTLWALVDYGMHGYTLLTQKRS